MPFQDEINRLKTYFLSKLGGVLNGRLTMEGIAAPGTPDTGYLTLYSDPSGRLCGKNPTPTTWTMMGDFIGVRTSAAWAHNSSGSWLAVPFDTELYDVGGLHDNVTNNTRITIARTGNYILSGWLEWSGNATGLRGIGFKLDGSTYLALHGQANVGAGSHAMSISQMWRLSASSYVELVAYQNSGGNLNINQGLNWSAFFTVCQIG